ncbi:MAG: hypothetical protein ABI054_10490, partial [Planctomycetota bacterium]
GQRVVGARLEFPECGEMHRRAVEKSDTSRRVDSRGGGPAAEFPSMEGRDSGEQLMGVVARGLPDRPSQVPS